MQRMWHGLAKEFAKRGHEVTILARAYPGQPEHENSDGIRIVRWGGYDQGTNVRADLLRCLWYAVRAARRLPPGDIVVTNDFWMPVFAARRKKVSGKVVINANRFPKGQYGIYGGVDLVAGASRAVAQAIQHQTPKLKDKIRVLPNPVDEAFLRPRAGDGRWKMGDGEGEAEDGGRRTEARGRTVLYVGRIHPEKGVDLLLEAWKRLGEMRMKMKIKTEVRLKIVGPYKKEQGGGGEEYLESLKRKAGGVEWGEPVFGAEELAKVYDSGDILVYPSQAELGEAMPLAPLEGMARGLPVVVSNLEVFKEYLVEGQNGWAFNHRESAVENLAAVLGSALNSDLTVMGQEARRTAERFSVQNVASMYVQAFEELLRG